MNLSIINVIPPNVPSSRKNLAGGEQKEIAYIEKKLLQNPEKQNKLDIKI